MNLYTTPRDSCLICALAMILDQDPEEIIRRIGHDGRDVIWDVPYPKCLRSFHIQELVDVVVEDGKALQLIELDPLIAPDREHEPHHIFYREQREQRFKKYLSKYRAILIYPGHAVAWDRHQIFDPKGYVYNMKSFPQEGWFLI